MYPCLDDIERCRIGFRLSESKYPYLQDQHPRPSTAARASSSRVYNMRACFCNQGLEGASSNRRDDDKLPPAELHRGFSEWVATCDLAVSLFVSVPERHQDLNLFVPCPITWHKIESSSTTTVGCCHRINCRTAVGFDADPELKEALLHAFESFG